MPWVDDPETGTSHYERPKKKRPSVEERKAAERAAAPSQSDSALHDQVDAYLEAHPPTEADVESFGQRMARIKREKAQAQEDAAAVVAKILSGTVDPS